MKVIFKDRKEAGILLGQAILKKELIQHNPVIVIGLPRGGVPVAFEVANLINSPMDVLFVRKLGFPHNEEVAMGAITESGTVFLDEELILTYSIPSEEIEKTIAREKEVISKRKIVYRNICPKKEIKEKIVILIDDGLATGATMFAAVQSLREEKPEKIIAAIPVSTIEAYNKLKKIVDEIICLSIPKPFFGVGGSYLNFTQVDDKEVCNLLAKAK